MTCHHDSASSLQPFVSAASALGTPKEAPDMPWQPTCPHRLAAMAAEEASVLPAMTLRPRESRAAHHKVACAVLRRPSGPARDALRGEAVRKGPVMNKHESPLDLLRERIEPTTFGL